TAAVPQNVTHGNITQLGGVAGDPLGHVLTNTSLGDPDRYAQIHDRKGRLIWYERMPGIAAANVDGPCQSFTYNPSTRTIFFTNCGTVSEIALDGSNLHTLNFGSLAPGWMPHHDVFRNAAGNWLVLAANVDTVDKSPVGGDPNALVVGPGIFEFTPTGSLVWSWSAFDHLDPLDSPGPGGDWVPKFGPQAINWLDANSVMQDGDGNPMLSFGGESQVVKIARTGSNIVWTCGDNGDIEVLPTDSFLILHGLRPSRPGYYLSLDNQGLGNGQTRAIEWWIDFSYIQARFELSWQHVLPIDDYTAMDGNVDRQRNGNFMIGSADGRSVTEINVAGSVLWHAQYDSSLQRAYWVEDLYERVYPQYLGDSVVCANDMFVILEASPAGGIWSGPFVSGDTFFTDSAGAGSFPLTYQWGPEKIELMLMVDPTVNCGVGLADEWTRTLAFSAFPNPFLDVLNLELELSTREDVTVDIFALDGRLLVRQELGKLNPGRHSWRWESMDAVDGACLVRVGTASGKAGTRILIRE
ncbi:MAG TPA: aryl-sulfate sulfotransferase, partial [Bacteroidia bacterium]|nr:aryl-sulfate sulfotransferase [Bacteroidia bacterium]